MDSYEDDDDTHFCIKCHATVTGLENYVRHRQGGCCKPSDKASSTHDAPVTPTTVSYPEILNADAFFNSLELQSSSKKPPRRDTTLQERSRKPGKQEVKKRNRRSHADPDNSTTKVLPPEKLHNMIPVVTELDNPTDHLLLPSLVGFPDIVTSTSKPATVTSSKPCTQHIHAMKIDGTSYQHKPEPLPENALENLMSVGASTPLDRKRHEEARRIDQVWLGDTILADLVGHVENKAHTSFARYTDYDYQQEEESDEESLDDDMAEEYSYSDTDDAEDREYPPSNHTGGKWTPGLRTIPEGMTQLGEDEGELDQEHPEHPPPSHTGGKWKPADSAQTQKDEAYESKVADAQPSPGHTRGKWVPGAQGDIGSGYWCTPCGRRLASRVVYNRHLLSDLHARRSIQELDGSLRLPPRVGPQLQKKSRNRGQKSLEWNSEDAEDSNERDGKKRLRKRDREVLFCVMCHARVRRLQMGKHLLSHYHCRVAGANPCSPKARRFLLENMGNVVRQCPFQCAACRFYCNTEETFLMHWLSNFHTEIHQKIEGNYQCTPCDYWCENGDEMHAHMTDQSHREIEGNYQCTPCDYWCENGDEMHAHMTDQSHREVVSVVNGSLPIVIRRQRPLTCGTCSLSFRYNLQLRLHARETGHDASTGSDSYQQRMKCPLCPRIARSLISLQRHQIICHQAETQHDVAGPSQSGPYFCSFCSLNFTTAQNAVQHRRTSKHKEMVRARKSGKGSSGILERQCPHCEERHLGLTEYKEHLLQIHPELCHKCPRCGMIFPLPQDVTRHTRDNSCLEQEKLSDFVADAGEDWQCTSCTFTTTSQSEFMFHEALHTRCMETVEATESDDESVCKIRLKYQCPICQKLFFKASLRDHIRGHTGERPFPCSKCNACFSRRSTLNAHQRECTSTSSCWMDETNRQRMYTCSECSYAFYTKHALKQHMLRHSGKKHKCGLPGCPTVFRTAAELRAHRALIHESTASDRPHQCSQCLYAAKTSVQLRRHQRRHEEVTDEDNSGVHSCPYTGCQFRSKLTSHLRRHLRRHTGTKPYKCRYCTYSSSNLENLRKHVLSTNLHPGKTIYECSFCNEDGENVFTTNFSKELRAHLLDDHPDKFPTPMHASAYVSGIFNQLCDSTNTENPTMTM